MTFEIPMSDAREPIAFSHRRQLTRGTLVVLSHPFHSTPCGSRAFEFFRCEFSALAKETSAVNLTSSLIEVTDVDL